MSYSVEKLENCPECGALWKTKDIYESMLEQYAGNHARAKEAAEHYGWSEENRTFFTRLTGIYDCDKDCTVAWQCPDCSTQWDRFTGVKK